MPATTRRHFGLIDLHLSGGSRVRIRAAADEVAQKIDDARELGEDCIGKFTAGRGPVFVHLRHVIAIEPVNGDQT